MAAKLLVLAAALAACRATPFFYSVPGEVMVVRAGRFAPPSIAYGIGGGFASDIGGIRTTNSFGTSFESGNAKAFGAGIGQADDKAYAGGVGYAHTNPTPYPTPYRAFYPTPYRNNYPAYSSPFNPYYSYPYNLGYNNNFSRNNGNAISPTTNQDFGTSIAQAQNGPFGAVASAANFNQPRNNLKNSGFGSASATAVSTGYATAISSSDGSGIATSSAHTRDAQGGFNSAVAASQTTGDGTQANTAQTIQQNGGAVRTTGSTIFSNSEGQISNAFSHNNDLSSGTYY